MSEATNNLINAFLGMRSKLVQAVAGIVPQRDLEDVVQDTYLRIRDVKSTEKIRNPESFIYRTARNLALDRIKRAESRLVDAYDDVESAAELVERVDDDATYREVASSREFGDFCSAVHELPEQCRRVFVLRKVYGFSQKEIAASLSISESAVEKHVARGLKLTYLHLKTRQASTGDTASVIDLDDRRAKRAVR